MTRRWAYGAVAAAAAGAAAFWPLTPAIPLQEGVVVRAAAAVLAAVACGIVLLLPALRPVAWIAAAVVSAGFGVALLVTHLDAAAACVADYDGTPVVIGRAYRPESAQYIATNPAVPPSERLLDVGGKPEAIWTAESIRSCRRWLTWGGPGAIPFFALCAAALLTRKGHRLLPWRPAVPMAAGAGALAPTYDAFLSYRHTEPDRTYTMELLDALERRGFRAAIDVRDFAPNEHFLSEMERCIRQSRFVLCVITPRYLESDHTSEEAVISKTVDLAERRRRLVPLIFERVELPVWLHGLVGIDFGASAAVDPVARLAGLLTGNMPRTDRPGAPRHHGLPSA